MNEIDSIATGGYSCGDGLNGAIMSISVDGYICEINPGGGVFDSDILSKGKINKREKQIKDEDEIAAMIVMAFIEMIN